MLATCAICNAEPATNILSIHLVDLKGTAWPAREVAAPVTKEVFPEAITRDFPQKFESRHVQLPPSQQPASLDAVKLVSPPVIADADFLAYDTTKHTFTVTAQAATRLATSISKLVSREAPYVYHTGEIDLIPGCVPFVVKARGESVYSGTFFTFYSSVVFSGPLIFADQISIRTNVSENATFSFCIVNGLSPSSDELDPRNDVRVLSAVQSLFASRRP